MNSDRFLCLTLFLCTIILFQDLESHMRHGDAEREME
jgi:hypothetical protein